MSMILSKVLLFSFWSFYKADRTEHFYGELLSDQMSDVIFEKEDRGNNVTVPTYCIDPNGYLN
uniref:Uncharacterized protein n=1 Tax=Anguilla anguilla TaxID=7936 RepID=A0A0E9WV17_ANGAN